MSDYKKIRAVLMRGGTSKALFVNENELPQDAISRDRVILRMFGSPDVRQIDGIGGADPLTSKLAIIAPSTKENADIDYTFAYVGVDKADVDYAGNCGNISSAVGPYAIDEGFVKAVEPITMVRINNTNTGKIIVSEVYVKDGKACTVGDYSINGVPGSGSKIRLSFPNSQGAVTGKLLPTGTVQNEIQLSNGLRLKISIVDVSTPAVFFKAKDIGLTGTEMPSFFDSNKEVMNTIEEIRLKGAELIGLYKKSGSAKEFSTAIPKIVFVAEAQNYVSLNGDKVDANSIDLVARTKALGVIHKAYAITGGICTAAAASVPGTIVNEIVSPESISRGTIRLGHPSGTMEFDVEVAGDITAGYTVKKAAVNRTARRIMDGYIYIPEEK